MIKDVLLFRMEKFLEREKQRRVARILSLEKEFSGMINLSGAKIKFKAIVDRIDLLEDKSTLILDYKTGGSEIMPKTDPREIEQAGFTREALKTTIRSFQLPLYLYLVAGQPEFRRASLNACLYLVKDLRKNSGLCPLFKEEEEAGERDVLMKVFLAALAALVQEILDPKVAFKADEKDPRLCAACPFFNLCR
jgi:RecB family exonuclease